MRADPGASAPPREDGRAIICHEIMRRREYQRAEAAEAEVQRLSQVIEGLRALVGRWRTEAAEEQRVSFHADELDAALTSGVRPTGDPE